MRLVGKSKCVLGFVCTKMKEALRKEERKEKRGTCGAK